MHTLFTHQSMKYDMEDLLEQANEIQETISRSYAVPDEIDEDELQAGQFPRPPFPFPPPFPLPFLAAFEHLTYFSISRSSHRARCIVRPRRKRALLSHRGDRRPRFPRRGTTRPSKRSRSSRLSTPSKPNPSYVPYHYPKKEKKRKRTI